jgi:hypothetical protein
VVARFHHPCLIAATERKTDSTEAARGLRFAHISAILQNHIGPRGNEAPGMLRKHRYKKRQA